MTPLNPQGTPSVVERLRLYAAKYAMAEGVGDGCREAAELIETLLRRQTRLIADANEEKALADEAATLILTLQERIETLERQLRSPRLPRLTEDMIDAAMRSHYGNRAGNIDGVDLCVDGIDWSFRQGFTRMWRGIARHLKARSTLSPEGEGAING